MLCEEVQTCSVPSPPLGLYVRLRLFGCSRSDMAALLPCLLIVVFITSCIVNGMTHLSFKLAGTLHVLMKPNALRLPRHSIYVQSLQSVVHVSETCRVKSISMFVHVLCIQNLEPQQGLWSHTSADLIICLLIPMCECRRLLFAYNTHLQLAVIFDQLLSTHVL